MRCGAGSRFWRSGPRLLSSGVLWRSLVAACPTAATIASLVLLPVAAILATAATRRPEQRQADYPAKAQTQELPATQGHSKNGIASGCRFSFLRHRGSPFPTPAASPHLVAANSLGLCLAQPHRVAPARALDRVAAAPPDPGGRRAPHRRHSPALRPDPHSGHRWRLSVG
jgi:hypothetical protein